jgi:hypothetical protein
MKTIHNWHLNISNDKVESVVFYPESASCLPCRGKQDMLLPQNLCMVSAINFDRHQ